jgi:hypothetical protein
LSIFRYSNLYLTLVATIFGLLVFDDAEIIYGNDATLSAFVWREILFNHLFTWWEYNPLGFNALNILQIPYVLINTVFNFSSIYGYILWISVTLVLWNSFFFTKGRSLRSTLFSIVAVFNPLTIVILMQPITSYAFIITAVPLVLLSIKKIQNNDNLLSNIILFLSIWASMSVNLAHFSLLILLVFSILLIENKVNNKFILLRILVIIFIIVLPIFISLLSYSYMDISNSFVPGGYLTQTNNSLATLLHNSSTSSLDKIISSSGFVWIGDLFYSTNHLNKFGGIFSLLFIFSILSFLFLDRNTLSMRWFILIGISLLFLFFAKGVNPPFEFVNYIFAEPIALPFRNNYDKFFIFYIFAFIIGLNLITKNTKEHSIVCKSFLLFLIILYSISLLLVGDSKTIYTNKNIPKDLQYLSEIINSAKKDENLLYVPGGLKNGYVERSWYKGYLPDSIFFRKKIFYLNDIYKNLDNFVEVDASIALPRLGIKYIIVDRTTLDYYMNNPSFKQNHSTISFVISLHQLTSLESVYHSPGFTVFNNKNFSSKMSDLVKISPTLYILDRKKVNISRLSHILSTGESNLQGWKITFIEGFKGDSFIDIWSKIFSKLMEQKGEVYDLKQDLLFAHSLGEAENNKENIHAVLFFMPQLFLYLGLMLSIFISIITVLIYNKHLFNKA